jgi:secondary thiamine-phosphate synthase enzyme
VNSITVQTQARTQLLDITAEVQSAVAESGVREGMCYVFVPHTTAGLIINEGSDANVQRDLLTFWERMVPSQEPYRHGEGNAAAHIKASLVGPSKAIPVTEGRMALGGMQALYFCEFDGPRERHVCVEVLAKR